LSYLLPSGTCLLPSAAKINKRPMIENRKIASLTPIGFCFTVEAIRGTSTVFFVEALRIAESKP